MALLNTKRSAFFLKNGATLPVTPANFFEVSEEFVINPTPTIEEYNRISGQLGTMDSFADTCHVVLNQTFSHKMRSSDSAATALETVPEYGEMLKTCGFDETIDTDTGGQETVIYTNSQAPVVGSGVAFIDDKKYTLTDTVVADATFNFEVGKAAMLDVAVSGFLDASGVPSDATLVLSSVSGLSVGDTLTGDTSSATGTVLSITGTTVEMKSVTGTYTVGGEGLNTAAYTSTSASQSNPTVTLSDEPVLIVSCGDILTAGGSSVSADKISITMGADVQELYALGLKEFNIADYVIKLTAEFYVDSADYEDAMVKLNAETTEAIVVKLGTNQTGSLISGKSVHITADVGKASAFTDSIDKSKVKRSFTWLLRPNGSNENISIAHGYFA